MPSIRCFLAVAVALVPLLGGCAGSPARAAPSPMFSQSIPAPGAPPAAPPEPASGGAADKQAIVRTSAADGAGAEVAQSRAPMLVYNAKLQMAVFEVAAGLSAVEVVGREAGGFLAKRDDNSITIRVPAARFAAVVARLEKMGDMLHRDVNVEDVTAQYLDLDIRLRNARAVRDRLQDLLARASTVKDSLEIEKELARVAGEVDAIEGKLKYLRDQAAFSTITVVFQSRASEESSRAQVRLPFPWLNTLGLSRLLAL